MITQYNNAKAESVECHLHALMCSVTVVFIHTMEDDQRLNTLVHEGYTLATLQDRKSPHHYCTTTVHSVFCYAHML